MENPIYCGSPKIQNLPIHGDYVYNNNAGDMQGDEEAFRTSNLNLKYFKL
jgi:hypothetical protein